jgi:photosystem II stability/assembly factor-like uncharacterized protein
LGTPPSRHARRMPLTGLALAAVVLLGGLQEAQAGIDVWTATGPEGGTIGALAIDPQNPATLYAVVSGDASNSYSNSDVFKSTDAGRSWRAVAVGLPSGAHTLAIDPRNSAIVYVGTVGGLFKSTDGGGSWITSHPSVSSLIIDAQTPTTLYAATRSWRGRDILKSTDGGGTWTPINTGLPRFEPGDLGISALAIDPQTPTTLYAVDYSRGLFKSLDGGDSWTLVRGCPNCGGTVVASVITTLAVDPKTPTILYAGVVSASQFDGFYKSTDGGVSWRAAAAGLPPSPGRPSGRMAPAAVVAIDPQTPTTLYAISGGALFRSVNGADNWSAVDTGPPMARVSALAIDPQTPTTLYVGTSVGLRKSADGGGHWTAINTGLTRLAAGNLTIDPQTPTTLYADGWGAGVFKSTDGGGSWTSVGAGPYVAALVIDPQTPTTVYAGGTGGVFKSTDGGGTWSATNTGLTSRYVGGPFVRDLAIDPLSPSTLYASTDDGVFKSTDGGGSWHAPNAGSSLVVAIDPQTPTTLYAGFNYGSVYKSTDGGASWFAANAGLPGRACAFVPCREVFSLALDPQNSSTLYAGTFAGVFKSIDGGGHWTNTGLTSHAVKALAIDLQTPTTLYAGTAVGPYPYGAVAGGVFTSTNAGASWSALNAGLTSLSVGALVIDPLSPSTLYAGTGHGVFVLRQTTISGAVTTTVNFDTPIPLTPPTGALDGVFEGIDFGTGQWAWEGPFGAGRTNHIYFADWTGTSRTFAFSPAPRVLQSMRVFSPTPGILTLADDAGQTLTSGVANFSMQPVNTGWTRPSTTVTVSFTNGWDLGIDDITTSTAP